MGWALIYKLIVLYPNIYILYYQNKNSTLLDLYMTQRVKPKINLGCGHAQPNLFQHVNESSHEYDYHWILEFLC